MGYAAGGGGHLQPDFLKGAGPPGRGHHRGDRVGRRRRQDGAVDQEGERPARGALRRQHDGGLRRLLPVLLRHRGRAGAHQDADHEGPAGRHRRHQHHRRQQQGDDHPVQADPVRRDGPEPHRPPPWWSRSQEGKFRLALSRADRGARRQAHLAVPQAK